MYCGRCSLSKRVLRFGVDPGEARQVAEADGGDPPAEDDDPDTVEMSFFAFQMYCYFDVCLEDGTTVADAAIAEPGLLGAGERAFVQVGRGVSMRLYEVTGVTPGENVTLRDCVDGSVRTVRERTASGTLVPWDLIATRVLSAIAHRLTETSDTRAAVQRSVASGAQPGPAPVPPPEVAAQIEAMLRAHYERWLDESVPMFDGLTPRQAAASEALRPRVREALRDLEHMAARARQEGQPAFDPSGLRRELGLRDDE